jgi:serine-aspartate repeat-containing protein C/D/E
MIASTLSSPAISNISGFNISGFKINNNTGNGIPGWSITLSNDTMTTNTTTDSDGAFVFTGLANGTYNLIENVQVGWTSDTPSSTSVTIAGADMINQNFTNTPPTPPKIIGATITGRLINDLNGNGKLDSNDIGLQGWTVNLLGVISNNSVMTEQTVTDQNGTYIFNNLTVGRYYISEQLQPDFIPVSAPFKTVKISASFQNRHKILKMNFFNKPTVINQ